jgi:23S rRNA (adenine2503-C2)-methyltransferase
MKDLRNYNEMQLKELLASIGEKTFRGKQIYEWVSKGVETVDEMTNLPLPLRNKLKQGFYLDNYRILEHQKANDGTIKAIGALHDGNIVESVFMTYKHGHSACISTQVGCKMKCAFCASTLGGVVRSLTAGEYLGQIMALQNLTGKRVNNVVLMGSGEPLDNYNETLRFIKMATDVEGLNLSVRGITLSTCGLVPEIYKLADEKLGITLAISLHNPFQEERAEIMPITRKYSVEELIKAVKYYIEMTSRRVTFEYALIENVNDSILHAEQLGVLLKGMLVHVNLIPVNAVAEKNYMPSKMDRINAFKQCLENKYHINTTIRRELGSDINAACGQLRNSKLEKTNFNL